MTTYTYMSYEQERKQRREEWERAPKECPYCRRRGDATPINQHFSEWGREKPRKHCGADRCRKAASREGIAERKRQERSRARNRMLQYCNEQLDRDQRQVVMDMVDMLMVFNYDEGHKVAEQVIQVIENKRCKHDRIGQLEEYAAIWKRKAAATEQQLKARIEELEDELAMFNALEATIHGIARRQLQQQPDPPAQPAPPEPEPEDSDRAQVLATLKEAGLMSIEEAKAAGEWEDDDTEQSYGYGEDEED